MTPSELAALRSSYARFLGARPGRILLTGHSHQAWPDVARDAMQRCFDDAAEHVDDKWGAAVFPLMERVGRRVLARSGFDPEDAITFGKSTHELVYRLLSALPRDARVVTTTGEFHSLFRQLRRLEEDGLRVTWVPATPRAGLAERLAAAVVPGVDLVAFSAVLYEDAYVLPDLAAVLGRAREVGAHALVDAYHAFNVVPLTWGPARESAYVVAGGYKYAAFGEGVCWLRSPKRSTLRPAYSGWFADFGSLARPRTDEAVRYAEGGARFAGATFDAAGLYRADAVLSHWDSFGLTVEALRRISMRQTSRIVRHAVSAGLTVASAQDPERLGGFVALRVPGAEDVATRLRDDDVFVDARADLLRLGPAPFLTDAEIDEGVSRVIARVRAA